MYLIKGKITYLTDLVQPGKYSFPLLKTSLQLVKYKSDLKPHGSDCGSRLLPLMI